MKKGMTWEEEINLTPSEIKNSKRYYRRRLTKSGYPIDPRPFTYDEIKAYQSTERIICLRCGHGFASLAKHLVYVHNVSVEEYKEMYGLPNKRGLGSPTARKNYGRAIGERMRKMIPGTKQYDAFFDPETREANRKIGVVASQKQVMRPFRAELSRAHLKKARNSDEN